MQPTCTLAARLSHNWVSKWVVLCACGCILRLVFVMVSVLTLLVLVVRLLLEWQMLPLMWMLALLLLNSVAVVMAVCGAGLVYCCWLLAVLSCSRGRGNPWVCCLCCSGKS